jgi:hypothetical protein
MPVFAMGVTRVDSPVIHPFVTIFVIIDNR